MNQTLNTLRLNLKVSSEHLSWIQTVLKVDVLPTSQIHSEELLKVETPACSASSLRDDSIVSEY